MRIRSSYVLAPLALLSACMTTPRPAPVQPVPAPDSVAVARIAASSQQTWWALVETFKERGVPVMPMLDANGAMAVATLAVPGRTGARWAECGTSLGLPVPPDRATYQVLVGGDASSSTTTVLVHFTASPRDPEERRRECVSTGAWERELNTAIRTRAERLRVASARTASR